MVDIRREARIAPSWQDRLQNDAYKNWLKVGYGIHIVCTGIRPYIERESKVFHGSLLAKSMAPCTCVHVPSRRPNAFHDMAVCDWAKELENHHTKRNPKWSQSDGNKWTDPNVGHWEVTKLYMPFACAHGKTSAQETDATGLLNLLQFCDHYVVDRTRVDAFKTTRNTWAHASQHELNDDQKQDAFTSMKDLLTDAELLADTDAKTAFGKIKDLELKTLVEFEKKIVVEEYMETILQEINSLKEKEDDNANNIIGEIREVKQILKSKASIWKNCCKCFHAAWTFLKAMPEQLVVILILLSCSLWLNTDTEENGCLSNSNFDYLELKQFDFTEYLHSARQDFVGRQWLFKKLTDTLRNSNNTENGFLIIAAPGFGKSSLMSNLICTKPSSHSINTQILGYHFCIHTDKTTKKGGKIVQNLANMIAFRIRPYKDLLSKNSFLQRVLKMECTSDPSGCFQQAILAPLIRLSNDYNFFREMYIVVDALDECIDENESEKDASIINILGKKSRRFPKWLKVIATARNVSSIKRQLKHFNQIELFQEDQRNLRDIQDFLTWKFPFNETIISKLVNQSQGNFLYIRLVSEHIEQNWFNTEEWESLPASIESAYQDFFDRKFGSVEKFRAARNICEILVSTLHPLTVAEIYDILFFENKDFHEDYDFMPILDDFSDYLRYTGENKYLSFFHSSLQEWLTRDTNRGGKYFVDQVNGNRLLARYFLHQIQDSSVPVSTQFVYQLATYMVRGGRRTNLINKFLNIDRKFLTTADTTTNMTALHLAAGDGDDRLLKLFLNIFKNLDIVDGKGRTPLFYAVRSGLMTNVRALHLLGASFHVITRLQGQEEGISEEVQINDCELQMCGYNLVHVAAQKGHHKILKYLLENSIGISIISGTKEKAIHIAAKFGHIEILNTLVEHGETLDHVCLYNAVTRRQLSVVKFLLQHGIKDECRSCEISAEQNVQRSCNTALHIVAIEGFHKIADLLLNKSEVNALTCVNLFGREPLHEAIRNNNYQVAKGLLQSGANPSSLCSRPINTNHMTKEQVDEICRCGFSSLHIAAFYGFPEITELLLQYKADYNAGDCDDMQPIHIAACRGHGDVLSVLVKNGVDINSKNSKGMTATHYACKCKAEHIFETLAALGADGYAVTVDNKLPLDFIFPHFKFNRELFQFADSYVQNPIDPIDFSSMYSVEKPSGSAWNKIWTKFLIKFPMSEQQELDAVRDITFKVTVEQYKEIFASNVPQMIFASHWFSYALASVITSVNHNLDVSVALRQLNVADHSNNICTPVWQDNPSVCAELIEKIQANMVYATDVLLSYVINVNCETSGLTPILAYLKTGGRHMAKVLAKHAVKVNVKCGEKFENSTFHLSAYHKLHYLHYLTIFQDPDEWEKYLQTKDALFDYLFDEYENVTKEGKSRIEGVRDGPVTRAIKSHPKGFKIIDNCVDDEGYTALHRAAQGGNVVAVKHFLDWGANFTIKPPNTEFDPLVLTIWYAIKYRPHNNFHKPSILTSLEIDFASLTANVILDYLTKNKSFNIGCDKQKATPTLLHLAATRGMWRFIEKLFVARDQSKVVGLDANCPTKHGITPLYLARIYGGGECQLNNPWCKVINVLLENGGSEEILPQKSTEYYIILNFIFPQLPRQLDLESGVKKTLQDMYKDCEPDVVCNYYDMQPKPDLFEQINDFIPSITTAKKKHNQLNTEYNMFLIFITNTITFGFSKFNELDGTELRCATMIRHMLTDEHKESNPFTPQEDSDLQSERALSNSNGQTTEQLPKCSFGFTGEVIIYPIHMLYEPLSFCSESFTKQINSLEYTLHHNHHSFLASYRKYNKKMEIIKATYYDYPEEENEKIRKYENQARCLFGKTTYMFARLKFLLHTMKYWNHQVNEISRAIPSISTYMLQKIKELILSDDRQKMTELILQLTQEDSVEDHEYLKMLRFSKAPMYDRTMYDRAMHDTE